MPVFFKIFSLGDRPRYRTNNILPHLCEAIIVIIGKIYLTLLAYYDTTSASIR
jgi:hypothetical protein